MPAAAPVVTVRYWAAARAAVGRAEEQFQGSTVAEVLAAAVDAHRDNPRFAQIISISSVLLGDKPVTGRKLGVVRVKDADVLEVLPPFAGG
ncbi:MAG: MoaD/ThiS family protein [Nocardioidaceae bacterium]